MITLVFPIQQANAGNAFLGFSHDKTPIKESVLHHVRQYLRKEKRVFPFGYATRFVPNGENVLCKPCIGQMHDPRPPILFFFFERCLPGALVEVEAYNCNLEIQISTID